MISLLILLFEVLQVVIAVVASIVFFVFAGVTLAGSAVALTVTTPLFIIFSPILVPATIATAVLATGLTASGTLGAMAVALLSRKIGVKSKKSLPPRGASPTGEGSSSAPSALKLFQMPKFSGGFGGSWGGKPFSGTFGGKSAGGAAPTGGSNPIGGFGGSWGGKSFSGIIPGLFGPGPVSGSTPAGGAKPAAAAKPKPAPAAKPT